MKKIGLLPKLILGITLGIIIGYISQTAGTDIPVRILATFNGVFGNFLGFAIPLIIIGFVAPGIGDLGSGAGKILGITTGIAYTSTVIAGSLAFFVAYTLFPMFLQQGSMNFAADNPEDTLLSGYMEIEMPPVMGVMTALLIAFVLGLGMASLKSNSLKSVTSEFQQIVTGLIKAVIIPLLPIHVMGVFCNMTYGGTVVEILSVFISVFGIILVLHFTMLSFQYIIAGTASGKNPIALIKTMIPAYVTAIGTQSSAASIPVTLAQTKKNGVSEEVADFAVPLCATIHLSGSTITLTSCSMAIMMLSGMNYGFDRVFPFILMLGVTMVAAPGVPGGAVMAALGILESMLGFNETQTSLMIALYLAQDSFGTACNVTGDGAIALLVDCIIGKNKNKKKEEKLQEA